MNKSKSINKSPTKKEIRSINKSPTIKKGKDGNIKRGKNHIISKVFADDKKDSEILKEYHFMKKAYDLGIAPEPISCDVKSKPKYILMEELEETLFETIKKTGGMTTAQQKQMICILHLLDENRIFHGDVSPLNFMIKNDKLYIIDFGMTKKMTDAFIKKHSEHANIKLGITFFILKTKEVIPSFDPKILKKEVFKFLKL